MRAANFPRCIHAFRMLFSIVITTPANNYSSHNVLHMQLKASQSSSRRYVRGRHDELLVKVRSQQDFRNFNGAVSFTHILSLSISISFSLGERNIYGLMGYWYYRCIILYAHIRPCGFRMLTRALTARK